MYETPLEYSISYGPCLFGAVEQCDPCYTRAMILRQIEIRNFRSISHLTISPRQITTFIGRNSCGKSNILRALQFFFTANPKSAIPEDVCKFADDAGTWVECTFSGLTVAEKDELGKYVRHDGTIRVRRTQFRDGDKSVTKLRGYVQRPTEAWLQDDYPDYADMEKWQALDIDVAKYATIGARGKLTKEGFKEFQTRSLAGNAEKLGFSENISDTEFKGRQSTAASLMPHLIFVPAVGDIVPVIYGKQNSLLNEMVGAVIGTAKTHADYQAAQQNLSAAQDFVNPSSKRLNKLTLIENDLADRLKSWPGTKVTIRTEIDDLAKILVNGLILSVDDGQDTDLADKGDGIQRQILFRVFQLYADFRAKRGVFQPDEGEPAVDRGPSIIAFEEPELFLHPQAQEQFYDDLLTVSSRDQVLLATHSSYLIRLDQADGLHIVRRTKQNAPTELRTADPDWLETSDRDRLKEINLCSGEVSKVFFADRVVVTEGQEDVICIIGTARDHAECLDRRVTVVEVGGNLRIPALQRVLNAFGIPYIVACDLDPCNQSTANNLERVRSLITDANNKYGQIARLEVFDPNIPVVCHGALPPNGKKYTSFDALLLIREGKPTEAFVQRVKDLFQMP